MQQPYKERKNKNYLLNTRIVNTENAKQAVGRKTSDFGKAAEYKVNISKINSNSNSEKQKPGKKNFLKYNLQQHSKP